MELNQNYEVRMQIDLPRTKPGKPLYVFVASRVAVVCTIMNNKLSLPKPRTGDNEYLICIHDDGESRFIYAEDGAGKREKKKKVAKGWVKNMELSFKLSSTQFEFKPNQVGEFSTLCTAPEVSRSNPTTAACNHFFFDWLGTQAKSLW